MPERCQSLVPTLDVIIRAGGRIVLAKRKLPPYGLALPGGFVDAGETLESVAAREARCLPLGERPPLDFDHARVLADCTGGRY